MTYVQGPGADMAITNGGPTTKIEPMTMSHYASQSCRSIPGNDTVKPSEVHMDLDYAERPTTTPDPPAANSRASSKSYGLVDPPPSVTTTTSAVSWLVVEEGRTASPDSSSAQQSPPPYPQSSEGQSSPHESPSNHNITAASSSAQQSPTERLPEIQKRIVALQTRRLDSAAGVAHDAASSGPQSPDDANSDSNSDYADATASPEDIRSVDPTALS